MALEKKFKLLDEVEHVLLRPGMYLGQVTPRASFEHIPQDGKMVRKEIEYVPALLKLFDEIITNSVDESVRNTKLNKIEIEIDDKTGRIKVTDNGGIPVVMHKEHKKLIPELVFSNLRAGSNFNDDEDRLVAGTHGLGSTLTNIFSKEFIVKTSDGKKEFKQIFTDNMSKINPPAVKTGGKGHTTIEFLPDYSRFGIQGLDEAHISLLHKRVFDLAACNTNVKFFWNGKQLPVKKFEDYAKMYSDEIISGMFDGWRISIGGSNDGFQQVSFVNSAETKDGGTHVNAVLSKVIEPIRAYIKKKHKVDVKPDDIKRHLVLVMTSVVPNPMFSTQTKEKLTNTKLDWKGNISDDFINRLIKSDVIEAVLDWAQRKQDADDKAALRKMEKSLGQERVAKLIDAKGSDRSKCVLGIFEGLSALSAVRRYRDPNVFGAYPLKGKFLNVSELKPTEILASIEASDLIASIGLKLGEPVNPAKLRYGKIYIYTDADPDGSCISCQLINFFARYWPELFEDGRVFRVMSPLAVAVNKDDRIYMYTMDDITKWNKKANRGYEMEYKKGLAALEDIDYEKIISSPTLMNLTMDKNAVESLDTWFGSDNANRKEKLSK